MRDQRKELRRREEEEVLATVCADCPNPDLEQSPEELHAMSRSG